VKAEKGFTLTEVLVALAILSLVVIVGVQIKATTSIYLQATRLRTEATLLAEAKLEAALLQPLSDPTEIHGIEGPFAWQISRSGAYVGIRVTWVERGQERALEVVARYGGG